MKNNTYYLFHLKIVSFALFLFLLSTTTVFGTNNQEKAPIPNNIKIEIESLAHIHAGIGEKNIEHVVNMYKADNFDEEEIAKIYKIGYRNYLTTSNTMTNGLWIILGLVIGLAFVGLGILVWLGYREDKDDNIGLNKGDIRKAITVYLIVLFGALVVCSYFPTGIEMPREVQGIFAGVVTTVIGFYFGSRNSESNKTKEEKPPENKTEEEDEDAPAE